MLCIVWAVLNMVQGGGGTKTSDVPLCHKSSSCSVTETLQARVRNREPVPYYGKKMSVKCQIVLFIDLETKSIIKITVI